jgi:hypothetical protein
MFSLWTYPGIATSIGQNQRSSLEHLRSGTRHNARYVDRREEQNAGQHHCPIIGITRSIPSPVLSQSLSGRLLTKCSLVQAGQVTASYSSLSGGASLSPGEGASSPSRYRSSRYTGIEAHPRGLLNDFSHFALAIPDRIASAASITKPISTALAAGL